MSLIERIWRMYRMNPMAEILRIALTQYGIREWSGANHNPEVVKYFTEAGFDVKNDETSWCSAFICWCVQKAGLQHTRSLAARSWLTWGEKTFEPALGDIAVLWRNDPQRWQGHVGIFVRQDGAKIWLLGGNQADGVNIQSYDGTQLLGYRRAAV